MNKYDELYEFRLATVDDIDDVMEFIKTEWKEDHILAIDKEFFCYEHQDGNNINYMLAINKETKKIDGIRGFIPYSRNQEKLHICGVVTKVKEGVSIPCLGVELMKRLVDEKKYKTFCGIGTNPKTMAPLARRIFKHHIAPIEHYYRLNDIEQFNIAKIQNKKIPPISSEIKQYELDEIDSFEELNTKFNFNRDFDRLPYKEDWYMEKRYFKHPIYKYRTFGLMDEGSIEGVLIAREVHENGSKILRYVDFRGNVEDIRSIGKANQKLMEKEKFEYTDFLLYGMERKIMEEAGFVFKEVDDENIIPTYFEPFVRENVNILIESNKKDMILFKGDADGDRSSYRK